MNCELSIADSPRHIAASLAKTSSDLLRSTEIRLLIPDGEPRWRFSRNELSGKPGDTGSSVVGIHNGACSLLRLPIAMACSVRSCSPVAMTFHRLSPRTARPRGQHVVRRTHVPADRLAHS